MADDGRRGDTPEPEHASELLDAMLPDAFDAVDLLDGEFAGDDDLEPDLPLAPAPLSIEPGPRRLVVPEGEIIRRVDRFVADRTGLSR
jgi:hypothetical protein